MVLFRNACLCVALFAVTALSSCRTADERVEQLKVDPGISKDFRAGEPIAATRKAALSSWPVSGEISPEQIKKCFEINSEATIKQYSLFLSPLSENEKKLLERVKFLNPPIITRTNSAKLKEILREKALLSPKEAERRKIIIERAVTPGAEDILFGAFDCVFATVGDWNGTPTYGDVIIRLKDTVRETGWATPWSGFTFMRVVRHDNIKSIDNAVAHNQDPGINSSDRLFYLMFVSAGKDWNETLGYEAIIFLRAQRHVTQNEKDALIEKLLQLQSPEEFWTFFSLKHFGKGQLAYLEAKFPAFVAAEYFYSIEVPEDKYLEIITWPEAAPFKNIIKIKSGNL